MATTRTCDYCKEAKDDVAEVQAGAVVIGAVYEGQPTGVSLAADSCEACRTKAYADLSKKAAKQLEQDIPALRQQKVEAEAAAKDAR